VYTVTLTPTLSSTACRIWVRLAAGCHQEGVLAVIPAGSSFLDHGRSRMSPIRDLAPSPAFGFALAR